MSDSDSDDSYFDRMAIAAIYEEELNEQDEVGADGEDEEHAEADYFEKMAKKEKNRNYSPGQAQSGHNLF